MNKETFFQMVFLLLVAILLIGGLFFIWGFYQGRAFFDKHCCSCYFYGSDHSNLFNLQRRERSRSYGSCCNCNDIETNAFMYDNLTYLGRQIN